MEGVITRLALVKGGRLTWFGVRETHAALVLPTIRNDPPLSGADAPYPHAQPAVGGALTLLTAAGLVREMAAPDDGRYRSVCFEAATDAGRVLGLDVGRRFVRAALTDLGGEPLGRLNIAVTDGTPPTGGGGGRRSGAPPGICRQSSPWSAYWEPRTGMVCSSGAIRNSWTASRLTRPLARRSAAP